MRLTGKHIFIVEDDPENRVVFQMSLITQGAKVTFERWGYDVLNVLRATLPIDLIILDLNLKDGISGYDIFAQIRAASEFDQIKIIAVSAIEPSIGIAETQVRGFFGFIAKPIDSRLFPSQISKILMGEHIWSSGY